MKEITVEELQALKEKRIRIANQKRSKNEMMYFDHQLRGSVTP